MLLFFHTYLEVTLLLLLLAREGHLGRPAWEELGDLAVGDIALLERPTDGLSTRVAGSVFSQPVPAENHI